MTELRETNRALFEAPVGTVLRCIKGFSHGPHMGERWSNVSRLTEGQTYVKAANGDDVFRDYHDDPNDCSIAIERCDAGAFCWWPSPDEHFEIVT